MIPENWRQVSLADVCDRIMVGLATSVTKYYRPNGVPIIRNQNITESGFNDSDMLYLEPEFAHSMPGKKVRARDVITVHTGYIGISCVVPKHYDGAHTFTTLISSPKTKLLDSDYLAYHLNSHLGKAEVNRLQVGGGRNNLNVGDFIDYQLVLPPLPEQRKIAEILGTWDEAIRLTAELIAAKQQRKKGLMQRLLTGEVRFAGFEGRPWQNVSLNEIFSRVTRKNNIGNTNVLTASAQFGLISQIEFFNRSVAGKDLSGYYLIRRGEFAYNRSSAAGYPFGAIKRLDRYDQGILSTLYICFRLKESNQNSDFMAHYFEAGLLDSEIYSIASEGARSHGLLNVGTSDFFNLWLNVPGYEEQTRIAEVLNACDQEIDLLQQKLSALQQQKKGLMQRLLTGQVRVKV